jgi:hypothetical protein
MIAPSFSPSQIIYGSRRSLPLLSPSWHCCYTKPPGSSPARALVSRVNQVPFTVFDLGDYGRVFSSHTATVLKPSDL